MIQQADSTMIHQPDGETGEKSENATETDWKRIRSACKDL